MLNIQEVYEQYFTIVYRYLLSLSHNTHIAEELTQETFFKALKKVDDFRGDCDLRVWLCQISRNTYYDYLKKNKKYCTDFQNHIKKFFLSVCSENCHLPPYPRCLVRVKAGQGLRITELVKRSGRN